MKIVFSNSITLRVYCRIEKIFETHAEYGLGSDDVMFCFAIAKKATIFYSMHTCDKWMAPDNRVSVWVLKNNSCCLYYNYKKVRSSLPIMPQSTFRGRVEIGGVYLPSQL